MKQSSAINNPFCLSFNVLNNLYIQYHFTGKKINKQKKHFLDYLCKCQNLVWNCTDTHYIYFWSCMVALSLSIFPANG